jgi:hypothetical protein
MEKISTWKNKNKKKRRERESARALEGEAFEE